LSRAPDGHYIFTPVSDAAPALVEEQNLSGAARVRKFSDLSVKDGGAMYNMMAEGRGPAEGAITSQISHQHFDCVGPATLEFLLKAASRGEFYELSRDLTLGKYEQAVLEEAIKFEGDNGLTQGEKTLLRRLTKTEEPFSPAEAEQLRQLANKLPGIAPSNLTREDQLIFKKAASEAIAPAVTNDLKRKPGLTPEEQAILRQMQQYMNAEDPNRRFVIPGGRFAHDAPPADILAKFPADQQAKFLDCYRKTIEILRRGHWQMQKGSSLYLPEKELPTGLWGRAKLFGVAAKEGAEEVMSPVSEQSTQSSGVAPIENMTFRAAIYPARFTALNHSIRIASATNKINTAGREALKDQELPHQDRAVLSAQLRGQFKVATEAELDAALDRVKAAGQTARNLHTQIAGGAPLLLGRVKLLLEGQPVQPAALNSIKDGLYEQVKAAKWIDAQGRITPNYIEAIVIPGLTSQQNKIATDVLSRTWGAENQLRSLEARRKKAGDILESSNALTGNVDRDETLMTDSKKQGELLGVLYPKVNALQGIKGELKALDEFSTTLATDPIRALAQLASIEELVANLESNYGLEVLGELDSGLRNDIIAKMGIVHGTIATLKQQKNYYLNFLEVRQGQEIAIQRETSFFSTDRLTVDDYEAFQRSDLKVLLDDPSLLVGAFKQFFGQEETRLYGPLGRDVRLSPRQVLNSFFYGSIRREAVSAKAWETLCAAGVIDKYGIFVKRLPAREKLAVAGLDKKETDAVFALLMNGVPKDNDELYLSTTAPELFESSARTMAKVAFTTVLGRLTTS
ncbi:MAG TPA: hypothetical protein VMT55_01385, partial [Candidatus Sulfotelmatobacter sp.]|nr:hypothetical protein [Candidatus Sulfotelmatobacter sp.]